MFLIISVETTKSEKGNVVNGALNCRTVYAQRVLLVQKRCVLHASTRCRNYN